MQMISSYNTRGANKTRNLLISRTFPFEDFFLKKMLLRERYLVNWWGGSVHAWGSCCFCQKLLNTQAQCGQVRTHKSPFMQRASALKAFSKETFTEAEHSLSQKCQLVP